MILPIPMNIHAKTLEVQWLATYGAENIYLYSIDMLNDN